MTDQRNEDLQRARREAAELLGVKDLEHATPAECLRIDLVVGLRACVDSGAAEALEGGRTDIGRLVAAVEQLTKLLPAVRAPVANEYGEDPRRALLAEYLAARQAAEDTASREASALEVAALELEQAAERAREPPEVVPADNVVPLQKPEPPPLSAQEAERLEREAAAKRAQEQTRANEAAWQQSTGGVFGHSHESLGEGLRRLNAKAW